MITSSIDKTPEEESEPDPTTISWDVPAVDGLTIFRETQAGRLAHWIAKEFPTLYPEDVEDVTSLAFVELFSIWEAKKYEAGKPIKLLFHIAKRRGQDHCRSSQAYQRCLKNHDLGRFDRLHTEYKGFDPYDYLEAREIQQLFDQFRHTLRNPTHQLVARIISDCLCDLPTNKIMVSDIVPLSEKEYGKALTTAKAKRALHQVRQRFATYHEKCKNKLFRG